MSNELKHPEQAEGAQGEREMREEFEQARDCNGLDFIDGEYWLRPIPECPDELASVNPDWWLWQEAWKQSRAALAQPSPAPELERPEVVGYCDPSHIQRMKADQISGYMVHDDKGEHITEPLMTVAQHDRMALERWQYFRRKMRQMRDLMRGMRDRLNAAKARVAELEAHCVRLGQGDAERYWENRWREEVAKAWQVPEEWRDMLASLQWHYRDHDDYWHRPQGYYCPQCGGEQSAGHKEGCELSALLAAAPAQGGHDA